MITYFKEENTKSKKRNIKQIVKQNEKEIANHCIVISWHVCYTC